MSLASTMMEASATLSVADQELERNIRNIKKKLVSVSQ